jgi:hypothetical protein
MGIIYLTNILHKILIYSKYTLFSVTIISRPLMIIIILEYTSNMVVHIHSGIHIYKSYYAQLYFLKFTKYTFVYS